MSWSRAEKAARTETHDEAPHDDHAVDVYAWRHRCDRRTEGSDNDKDLALLVGTSQNLTNSIPYIFFRPSRSAK
jgi:hypothetical protein